ncbi:hypothetical protein HME9304_01884 [Flagellimonas maritima]|uniref:Uncharacterized protein n=1 Tax=Flagellimonas maritima TaxID=1383885 RepID=A0A2Z4LT25_9FLAO|nr:hypothetical protein HME9304_01884 [Allomuricauda aurantiaca]
MPNGLNLVAFYFIRAIILSFWAIPFLIKIAPLIMDNFKFSNASIKNGLDGTV